MSAYILIGEDDEQTREFYQVGFPAFEFDMAADGHTLLAMAQARPYRLILVDIGMPGLTGTEVAQTIRSQEGFNQNTCICALSGDRSVSTLTETSSSGFDFRFMKPISLERLRSLFLWASEPGLPRELIPTEDAD